MNNVVIDASVAIKWFVRENGSDEALKLLDRLTSFYVPDLFVIEIDSILTKKVRKKELEIQEAYQKQKVFQILPYKLIPYKQVNEFAFQLSSELLITLYDAIYLAVAIDYDGSFYTADKRLFNGIVRTPFEGYVELLRY